MRQSRQLVSVSINRLRMAYMKSMISIMVPAAALIAAAPGALAQGTPSYRADEWAKVVAVARAGLQKMTRGPVQRGVAGEIHALKQQFSAQ